MLVVGSFALKLGLGGSLPKGRHSPLDLDIICTKQEEVGLRKQYMTPSCYTEQSKFGYSIHNPDTKSIIELEVVSEGSSGYDLLKYHNALSDTYIAPLSTLLMLKLSHRYLKDSPHFLKTMKDIEILRSNNVEVDPKLKSWFKKREDETYTYLHPKLNVSKDDFFTDEVPYTYDHDSIHEAVKLKEVPAYTKFLVGEVKTSKELFRSLPLSDKINAVIEESCVLALERSLIPYGFKDEAHQFRVFQYDLMKVCTSITSGWFREYAWENYSYALMMFNVRGKDFVNKFKIALDKGEILPYKEGKY